MKGEAGRWVKVLSNQWCGIFCLSPAVRQAGSLCLLRASQRVLHTVHGRSLPST